MSSGPTITPEAAGATDAPPPVEWERIELLASFQVNAMAGAEPGKEELERIVDLERSVRELRARPGSWTHALDPERPLTRAETELLSTVLAPLMREQVAWLYRQLDPAAGAGGTSMALVQRILPLEADEVDALRRAAAPNARLAREGLLRVRAGGPTFRIRPGPRLAELVPGLPPEPDPPGLVRSTRTASLDDLVLSPSTRAQLHEFVGLVRYKARVEGEWGGEATGGPIGLFSGPSGVGKSLSAVAVGGELCWPVYTIEMARIASRWVGVSERRLDKLLDAAHARPMVLVLNEGETFFSRRGEVKEARDRFANLFVSFLLDRIERHAGPFILTSNLRENIDQAFLRRFHCVIEFQKPDAAARTELWRRLLPPRAPRAESLDLEAVGESVALTGGGIRNAALQAAHLAAHEGAAIGHRHLALGVRREIEKRGRRASTSEMGCLAEFSSGEEATP